MALIIADVRENHGANSYFPAVIAENNKAFDLEISLSIQQITIGDYAIIIKSKHTGDNIMAAVFERKTWADLAASIKDKRAISQQKSLVEIRQKYGCYVFYIIEGKLQYSDSTTIARIPFKNLHAKVRHNLLRGFPYVQTACPESTAAIIVNFTRDIIRMYAADEIVLRENFVDSITQEYIAKISEINAMYKDTANQTLIADIQHLISPRCDLPVIGGLPADIKMRRIHTNHDIVELMWCAIPGVANKFATLLMQRYVLADMISASPIRMADMRVEISNLKFESGVKIGENRVAKIVFLQDDPDVDELKKISEKILLCVPSVSKETAACILEKYTLREICDGSISSDDIADIKNKKRRIGNVAAEKIMDTLMTQIIFIS